MNLDELKFDEKGLIPAIVVDSLSGKVLTLAYMNRESLEISMEKGLTCFYSRSRQELWLQTAIRTLLLWLWKRTVLPVIQAQIPASQLRYLKVTSFHSLLWTAFMSFFSAERKSFPRAPTQLIFSRRALTKSLKRLARSAVKQ